MRILRLGRSLTRLFVQLMLAGLIGSILLLADPSNARAAESNPLVGWWIAIDEWWPTIWDGAGINPMEGLLIIAPDGRAENRLMQFHTPDAKFCVESRNCSDAPVAAQARIVVADGRIVFVERVEGKAPVFFGKLEPSLNSRYRGLAVTGRGSWNYALRQGGRVLTLQTGDAGLTRTFVRIEPDRLRRLRAGLIVANVGAYEHWRCFLANATADDPAFDTVRAGRRRAPDYLDAFLKAASYGIALHDASSRPVPDEADPARRSLAGTPLERIMIEAFEGIRLPATLAERKVLEDLLHAFRARLKGAAPKTDSPLPRLPLDEADFAALARVLNFEGGSRDLFCLEP